MTPVSSINRSAPLLACCMGRNRRIADLSVVELPGEFTVWLSSPEAEFLKDRFVWVNWDAKELISRAEEIRKDPFLLKIHLGGVPM